ncbi:MAG: serine/threonine-protein kinase [Planctomycetota bacterium]|jgi:serine/threonine-protein kinase
MADAPLVLEPGDLVGRYRVTRLLGRGSTGSVYLARQPVIDRPVAVKVLLHADESTRVRFVDEARKLAMTEHPNIVEVFDVDEHDGHPFMVMRYVEGRSLRDVASGEGRLPAAVLVRIAATVAGALEHAHSRGVVHGDVKPANIIVAPTGEPVLVDWSPSRLVTGDRAADALDIVGTPGFMSPEQARGEPLTASSDVWGLGATVFALLARRPPCAGRWTRDTLAVTASRDPVDTLPLEKTAPGSVLAVVGRCLEKDPAGRYASADELRRALEAALDYLEFSRSDTTALPSPEQGQTLLLHVEGREEGGLRGHFREYEIVKRLGGGTYGEVFRARERPTGRDVALKVLRSEWLADEEAVARFRREATLVSRLSHPNIVRVHNFGRYGPSFFIAMELLGGRTLRQVINLAGAMGVEEALGAVLPVLAGLEAVHAGGVVHRDVKPSNVAVMDDRIALFDFGMACAADAKRLTMSGTILGSPAYMSPEQAGGLELTGASDVYSCGVVLYEALTCELPHDDPRTHELLRKIAHEPPVRVTERRGDLPTELVRALDAMLGKDPAGRPTAAGARKALKAALG